jgi:hypothetical protein
VLPVASGWFVAITSAIWRGFFFRKSTLTRRRGGLAEMIGGGGFFTHEFGRLGLIEYNGKFHDLITRRRR